MSKMASHASHNSQLVSIPLVLVASIAFGSGASVNVTRGHLAYRTTSGEQMTLAKGMHVGSATLSENETLVAFTRVLKPETETREGRSKLWICNVHTGRMWRLLRSERSPDPNRNLSWLDHPEFSLHDKSVYINAIAWIDEDAVHNVKLETGAERFIVDGDLEAIIRSGPYAGDLLVRRHTLLPGGVGFYYPAYLVRPSGQILFRIPNQTVKTGFGVVRQWLRKNGWIAS